MWQLMVMVASRFSRFTYRETIIISPLPVPVATGLDPELVWT
jgi:hypothetical protein